MSVFINDGGVEKEAKMIYVNDGGIDKLVAGGSAELAIGYPFEGGFLFAIALINGETFAYVVADKADQGYLRNKTSNTATPGTYSLSDGWANTIAMYEDPTEHPAAEYCRDYRGGDFDDWYLGAINEMNMLENALRPAGANTPPLFKTGGDQAFDTSTAPSLFTYGTSTSFSSDTGRVRVVKFLSSASTDLTDSKYSQTRIRPIRKFKIS